jgi:thiol:disulfide interchange protein DsbD
MGPLRETLDTVVLAKVYDTDAVFEAFKNDPRFPELKRGLPFFLILSSAGDPLWKGTDYRAHSTMIRELERAKLLERNAS